MRANVIDFPRTSGGCSSCASRRSCVLNSGEFCDDRAGAPHASGPIARGEHIYRQGDRLEALYVLRSGSAKSYIDSEDGLEQIVAFHFPGELLGFDALGDDSHRSSVVMLETATLCRVPYQSCSSAFSRSPELWTALVRAGARQMSVAHAHGLALGQKTAVARFAGFLLDLSARFGNRGCSRVEFNLSMPRQDIANHLSLAVETVSRLFGDLQAGGIIAVDRRHVRILALDELQRTAGYPVADEPSAAGN